MKPAAVILTAMLLLCGCASQSPTSRPGDSSKISPQPALAIEPDSPGDAKAAMTLGQIMPAPMLPKPIAPKTDGPPPDSALLVFARGTDALMDHQWDEAIKDFRLGLAIDPDSYDLYEGLGRAFLEATPDGRDDALAAFEHAAIIRPDDLATHLFLARQYLIPAKTVFGDQTGKAVEHLRLALQTTDYQQDAPASAAVDYFLARALQQQGYDQAALDQFTILMHRLHDATDDVRDDPDVGYLVDSPAPVWFQIGELDEKRSRFADAIAAYQHVADADPAIFAIQAEMARLQARLGQKTQAMRSAIDLVDRFDASAASLALLRNIYHAIGREGDITDALRKLHQQNPGDVPILSALAGQLDEQSHSDAARQLLESAVAKQPDDLDLFARLFEFYRGHRQTDLAARALILEIAAHPDTASEADPLWEELTDPMRRGFLQVSQLQKLEVPPAATAAKFYLISRLAGQWHRDALERSSLETAAMLFPPFMPAWRALVIDRVDRNEGKESFIYRDLERQLPENSPIVSELDGIAFLRKRKLDQGVKALETAVDRSASPPSSELLLEYAAALRANNDLPMCERILWTAVEQRPRFDRAWQELLDFYRGQNRQPDQMKVLARWLKADPGGVPARLAQVDWYVIHNQWPAAEDSIQTLLADHADNPRVLASAKAIYLHRLDKSPLIDSLEKILASRPLDFGAVLLLADMYKSDDRPEDASRLLDQTHAKVGNDPQLLYEVAALYQSIGRMDKWEETLQQVLRIDPTNVPASNDLGYAWADAGKNLPDAERMIRHAVSAEPDNQAFLDSLGWVLYKQGQFDEAAKYFRQAVDPAIAPDPGILDHFGDDLYRLGDIDNAKAQWKKSLGGLGDDAEGDNSGGLELQLDHKIQAAEAGKPVITAPLGLSFDGASSRNSK